MRATYGAVIVNTLVVLASSCLAQRASFGNPEITLSQGSIRINGIELRTDSRAGATRYISFAAAERALGQPQDRYAAGLGVRVYAWRDLGLHLQRGWRGPEKDKIFKFQVWFSDYYDKTADKRSGTHSGTFKGHVNVEGLQIGPETTLDAIGEQLDKKGFVMTKYPYATSATKGEVTIWTVETSNKIERIEVFINA
jgi:hypothetical protein